MVVREVVAAGGGDGLELVIGEPPSIEPSRCPQRVVEFIVRIVHLIDAEHLPETALIERTVMRDQRQPLDKGLYLLPDRGKTGASSVSSGPRPWTCRQNHW